MSLDRLKKVKTLQDIRLEKARMRYEMLIAENRLMDNFSAVEQVFVITTFVKRFIAGFKYAQTIFNNMHTYIEKLMFWRKDEKEPAEK